MGMGLAARAASRALRLWQRVRWEEDLGAEDEKRRLGSGLDGDRASPKSVVSGGVEKERDAGETSPPLTFGGAKSRVMSGLNSSTPVHLRSLRRAS